MLSPKNVGEISKAWLQHSIQSDYPDTVISEFTVDPSFGDLGYLGSICRVDLTFESNKSQLADRLIIKLPAENEAVYAQGAQLGAYATEANFYRHLANQGVGRAPRHYFSVIDPAKDEHIIAIEDLSQYRFVKQEEGACLEDCLTVMRALARFHGRYWNDQDIGGEWMGSIADWGDGNRPLIEKGLPLYRENLGRFIDNQKFLDKFEAGAAAYPDVCTHLSKGRVTLMHGDAHIRNLAFDDGHEEPVRFYDWQLCCHGPAAYDVAYFFVNSLPVADQKAHLDTLLGEYHRTLTEMVPDYTMDDLISDMAYSSLTLFGFIAWLGNILPPNDATNELVKETTPRYMHLMDHLGAMELIDEFI